MDGWMNMLPLICYVMVVACAKNHSFLPSRLDAIPSQPFFPSSSTDVASARSQTKHKRGLLFLSYRSLF
uniref:Secreted protein n=1 Tax=Oryza brachyantha TaxID=4533 RepID=J3N592_ORYBR